MSFDVVRFIAYAFAVMSGMLLLGGVVNPILSLLGVPFLFLTGLFYLHTTGGLEEMMYEQARRAARREQQQQEAQTRHSTRERKTRSSHPREQSEGMTVRKAREILGVDADADSETVDKQYRKRVKEVHPDQGGDEEEFKRVKEAYEVLEDG